MQQGLSDRTITRIIMFAVILIVLFGIYGSWS